MHPQLFQILHNANDTFWWRFMITFVHYSPESEWYPLVESAFGNDCARRLADTIRDRNHEANAQKIIPQMKVSDVLFFMDCELYMSQMSNVSISSDQSTKHLNENLEKGSLKKKAKKRSHTNSACKKCGKLYHHPDAVRKHARLKHPEWIERFMRPRHYVIEAEEGGDDVDL